MRALSALELLRAWERAYALPPVQRALALLDIASPGVEVEALAALSIGQRDAYLLTLRGWTFGSDLSCVVTSPECGERLSFSFAVTDVLLRSSEAPAEALQIEADGYSATFRLPNSRDLVELERQGGGDAQRLLERCVMHLEHGGEAVALNVVPEAVKEAVVARMAEADPQADVQLDLNCQACDHSWASPFDILSFFWREIDAWARRTVREVHSLASAYGWREADILAMSAWRRQLYLTMADA